MGRPEKDKKAEIDSICNGIESGNQTKIAHLATELGCASVAASRIEPERFILCSHNGSVEIKSVAQIKAMLENLHLEE